MSEALDGRDIRDTSVFSLDRVTKVYTVGGRPVYALREVSLNGSEKDFIAIAGPSGSGKTTLLSLIGCLDVPTSGDVYVRSKKVGGLDDHQLARIRGEEIGFVFQNFNLIPRLSAIQNVVLPMAFAGKVASSNRKAKAEELLRKVDLQPRMDHKPSELRGGERQRVSIARSLANDPSMILADEPTGNLDSESGKGVMELFKSLNEQGRTLVVVTHNPDVAEYSKRTVELRDGSIINR